MCVQIQMRQPRLRAWFHSLQAQHGPGITDAVPDSIIPFYSWGSPRGEVLAQGHAGWKWLSGVWKAGLDYSEPRDLYSKPAPENITNFSPHCLSTAFSWVPYFRSLPLQSLSNHRQEGSCGIAGIVILLFCSAPFMISLCPRNANVLAWHLRLSL